LAAEDITATTDGTLVAFQGGNYTLY